MNAILLDQSEFLVLLRAVQAQAIIGLPEEVLASIYSDDGEAQLKRGELLLERRGLLRRGVGQRQQLDGTLLTLATTIANPHRAILISREVPEKLRQIAVFYEGNQRIAQHSFPAPNVHKLSSLSSLSTMFERIQVVLDTTDCVGVNGGGSLPEVTFINLLKLSAAKHHEPVLQLLTSHGGMTRNDAELFADALGRPISANIIAFLKCSGTEIVDARELTILQGVTSLWSIAQVQPGVPRLKLTATTSDEVAELTQRLFNDLG